MKISYFIVPLTLSLSILTGCTSLTAPPNTASSSPVTEPIPDTAADSSEQQALADKVDLPNVDLTDEIFFKIVSSEVAFKRGEFAEAYATLMELGQKTHDPRLPKRALEMALLAKQPAQAFYASRFWYEYAPHSEEALQYYLGFLVLNNDYPAVKSLVGKKLENASPKERGLIILQTQRLVMRSANKDASFKLLEDICQPYPDYLESHLALAQAAFASNNSTRAMIEARAALKVDPGSQIAVLTVAQVSASPEESLKVLADFLSQNPGAHEVRRAYAGMLVEQKQYAEARSQFNLLLAEKPDDAAVLYTLGVLALQMNDAPAAEKNLKAFVGMVDATQSEQRDPTTAYLYLSQIADDKKDGAAAMAWLNKIQSYDGKNAAYFNAQLRLAVLKSKYESLERAREFLHEMNGSPEEKVQIIQLDAELLRNAGRDQEAIALLQEAIKNNPDNPDLLYDFAMMAEKFDRIDEMETALRHVIAINPENQHAYNALGYSLADRNIRLPEARILIEKALALAPDDAFIMDSMGWLEFRENKAQSALTYLERAYKIRPDADIAVHVGEVLWSLGEQQKAIAIWREAKQKDPKNASLKNTLERLKVNL
ncbi:tetratricopeptide (TPR) repeat protein [Oxalobacteraceae bacterium GrIS 1.18]